MSAPTTTDVVVLLSEPRPQPSSSVTAAAPGLPVKSAPVLSAAPAGEARTAARATDHVQTSLYHQQPRHLPILTLSADRGKAAQKTHDLIGPYVVRPSLSTLSITQRCAPQTRRARPCKSRKNSLSDPCNLGRRDAYARCGLLGSEDVRDRVGRHSHPARAVGPRRD